MGGKKNIVVLGAGFGGVKCALELAKLAPNGCKVILIDRNDCHIFHPSLYEVASAFLKKEGRIDFHNLKGAVSLSIDEIISSTDIEFVQDEIYDVDIERKKVILRNHGELEYEYVVFALGSETNYFGIPGLEQSSFKLKNVDDAINLRNAIEELFWVKEKDDRVRIVIAGGGFTGVELAGELIGYCRKLSVRHNIPFSNIEVIIIEAKDSILAGLSRWIREKAEKRLRRIGVKILIKSPIKDVIDSIITMRDGRMLRYDILVWTAGITVCKALGNVSGVGKEKGCIKVNKYMRSETHSDVFAIGDNKYLMLPEMGYPAPATLREAAAQGELAARNIVANIHGEKMMSYKPLRTYIMIPLGGKYVIGDLGFMKPEGVLAWIIKQLYELNYFSTVLGLWKAFKIWASSLIIFTKND